MIKSNAQSLAKAWLRREAQLKQNVSKAVLEASRVLYAESKKQLNEGIYSKPIPTNREYMIERGLLAPTLFDEYRQPVRSRSSWLNKPAWRRTGNLRRREKYYRVGDYAAHLINDAEYAKRRHDLPGKRKAPWRNNAIALKQDEVRSIIRQAFINSMRVGIIPKI